jgi:hypothetical protein
MREVEGMAEDAVPQSVDERQRVSEASRTWQIGSDGCRAVIENALCGAQPSPGAVVIVDLFTGTGECAEAFAKMRPGHSNLFYFGCTETQEEHSYIEAYLKDVLSEQYESGALTPTGEKFEKDRYFVLISIDLNLSYQGHCCVELACKFLSH